MTAEGRLARGKENSERGKFKNNSETLAYTEKKVVKEVKNAKPTK